MVNYIFFGFFLILLFFLSAHHVLIIQQHSAISKVFFLLYSFSQVALEVLAIIFIGTLIKRRFRRPVYSLFVAFVFLWFMSHLIDFVSVRLIKMSVWTAIETFLLAEGFGNLIELLHQTGISMYVWALLLPVIIAIPILGIWLYKWSEKLAEKRELPLTQKKMVVGMVALPLAMLAWDFCHSGTVKFSDFNHYTLTLPWKTTFLQPKREAIAFDHHLTEVKSEEWHKEALDNLLIKAHSKPNVYIFVAESLRGDYITAKSAPHITEFSRQNLSFKRSYSNANVTHVSWFSIFHSKFPYHFAELNRRDWNLGSMPLQVLKKMGYKIRLYTSATLHYYNMDKLIFGPDYELVDTLHHFPHYPPTEAYMSDRSCIDQLVGDLDQKEFQRGNCFIIFLDSTHFNYSFPLDFDTPFTPYASDVNFIAVSVTPTDLIRVKNRYLNSISYVDSLFGDFTEALKKRKLYKESVMVFTGDHGEEFFEHGQFFHASQLSPEQLNAPIYYKFGKKKRLKTQSKITSHMDIFPTVIDYLSRQGNFPGLMDGQSLFYEARWPYVFSARNQWCKDPERFQITDGKRLMKGSFSGESAFFSRHEVEVIDFQKRGETPDFTSSSEQKEEAEKYFKGALEKLFVDD